jgi:hypothetical protein
MLFYLTIIFINIFSNRENVNKNKAILERFDTLTYLSNALVIKSVYINQPTSYKSKHKFKKMIIQQEVFFLKNDSVLNRFFFPVKKFSTISAKKNKIKILENIIITLKLYRYNNRFFYEIGGYGGCNTCSEYTALFNLDGVKLHEEYILNNIEKIGQKIADYQEIISLDNIISEKIIEY